MDLFIGKEVKRVILGYDNGLELVSDGTMHISSYDWDEQSGGTESVSGWNDGWIINEVVGDNILSWFGE